MAVLSAVVWPGAIASFWMAAAQVWDPSSLPPPLFIPNRLGMPLGVRVPSPPRLARLFLRLLDGAVVLLRCKIILKVFLSPLTDVKCKDVLKMKAWLLSPITQQLKVIGGLGRCIGD